MVELHSGFKLLGDIIGNGYKVSGANIDGDTISGANIIGEFISGAHITDGITSISGGNISTTGTGTFGDVDTGFIDSYVAAPDSLTRNIFMHSAAGAGTHPGFVVQRGTENLFAFLGGANRMSIQRRDNDGANAKNVVNIWDSGGLSFFTATDPGDRIVAVYGALTATGDLTTTGNISGGGIITSGSISGANIFSEGLVSSVGVDCSGTISGANIVASGIMTNAGVDSSGTISGANIVASGNIDSSGKISGAELFSSGGATGSFTNIQGKTITVSGGLITSIV